MTAGHGSKRPHREEAAIAALLAEPTIAAAAEKARISESTLLRWLRDAGFSSRYREARRSVVEGAAGRLQQAATLAVDALARNLKCGIPAVEVGAAKATLDRAFKAMELIDLAERVAALEEAAKGGRP